jgi:hypothetical protein
MQHKLTYAELVKMVNDNQIVIGDTYIITPPGKCCYKCRQWRDKETEYYRDSSTRDGYSNKCKPCSSKYSQEKYIQNFTYKPEKSYAEILESKKSKQPTALDRAKARIKKDI